MGGIFHDIRIRKHYADRNPFAPADEIEELVVAYDGALEDF